MFFLLISALAFIPNGLGWSGHLVGNTRDYFWLYALYVFFYLAGYYCYQKKPVIQSREVENSMISYFQLAFGVSLFFFFAKFIYIGDIPLFSSDPYIRTKLGRLGGFVDFPTKMMALLGIIAYYFFLKQKKFIYLLQFLLSVSLNLLFAERSLLVFTVLGAIFLYANMKKISLKLFRRILVGIVFVIFLIGWVQIKRHGGKEKLDLSEKRSTLEVVAWVVHGDLTGSQKFGAEVVNNLDGKTLAGRYTLGIYLSVLIPGYSDHGATYLQKNFSRSKTARSAAIPYSYYMDFGIFSLIIPFIIGYISSILYRRFTTFKSPFYVILYIAFFFNLLWSVRAGNFPIDPKLIYFLLVLLFIFNPRFKLKLNNESVQVIRAVFICTLVLSSVALIIRW
ncbi:hypothetical protein GCM10009117_19080 [Gangjinia marincola]|uniref:Oligosaccharide repeat unit polymerase n=1 Tax=Gangjinia marincola TaxID=578463 RepID=A0ABP3XTQ8_9FLAO